MDLQVYAIILIVFLVSFMSYLFISKFLPHGKSFDEMIAEKKKMREEVLGASRNMSSGKQSNAGGKKKPKKDSRKKESQTRVLKEVTSNDSDASESSGPLILEPETVPEPIVMRKSAVKVQQPQTNVKKNKGKGGISVNPIEKVVLLKKNSAEEEVNDFEEIPVKDEEPHRSAVKEEVAKKHIRDIKKAKPIKIEAPSTSPKTQLAKEPKPVEEMPARKKRSEPSNSAVDGNIVHLVSGETGITPLIRELSRADLTKNQIQVLIDFLLNKQSDTFTHDPTEWSEGKSDLVQKLKKQLQERDAQLKNEQDALVGTHSKLKELRTEFNTEKVQFNANLKAYNEQLQNSRMEIKNLQSEIQFMTEKHNTEKQTMSVSFKQLQAQCIQMKESLKSQEGIPTVQQMQHDNQILKQDNANKIHQITELNAFVEETRQKDEQVKKVLSDNDNKIAEYNVHLRKKEERCAIVEIELRQRVQELSNRDNEIQKLNLEITRVKELEKTMQRQTLDMDQLKKQLIDQQQNNHADESNKTEIRNLQNALDSSKKELEAQRVLVNDYKVKLDDLNKKFTESKHLANTKSTGDSFLLGEKMNEMVSNHQIVLTQKDKQLADYQKQVEALLKAENELTTQIDEQKAKNNNHPSVEVTQIKDIFAQHFPDIKLTLAINDDGTKWLDCMLENLKAQLASNKGGRSHSTSVNSPTANNNNNVTNNNHLNNFSDVEKSNLNNSTVNGDSNSSTSSSENEIVLLQNVQLKTSVEEYKNIIAETESMLKNLETKVREQDAYWTKVVLMKDNEIESLKTVSEKS